jgi:hypothetical protein
MFVKPYSGDSLIWHCWFDNHFAVALTPFERSGNEGVNMQPLAIANVIKTPKPKNIIILEPVRLTLTGLIYHKSYLAPMLSKRVTSRSSK